MREHGSIQPSFFLRPLGWKDAPLLLEGRNSDHVRLLMLSQKRITQEEHRRWMEKRLATPETPYFIFLEGSKPLGLVGMTSFDEEHARGDWGFYLWATDAPSGAGTHMLSAFLDEIFLRRAVRKLCSQVINTNEKSLHLHRKLGFSEEGLLKDHILGLNGPQDVTVFGLFDHDWHVRRTTFNTYVANVAFLPPME
jgi:UDP-4-amino-4,6-dideoxy-N-acetyl-beta-L-altrosamine N-acetyltransferase